MWSRIAKGTRNDETRDDEARVPQKRDVGVRADNPIRETEYDALGRAKAARSFAEHVLSLDAREGMVGGVLGPRGSGNTILRQPCAAAT
jgi:hypothetical protein